MTNNDIENLKKAWVASVKRALACGFDVIEVHNAHGYLLHSFVSPASNKRTDEYGGSFENRTRLTREIVDLTREIIPKDMPLFLRISATDWLEEEPRIPESWKVEDTVRLAEVLAEKGAGRRYRRHYHQRQTCKSASRGRFGFGYCRENVPKEPSLGLAVR